MSKQISLNQINTLPKITSDYLFTDNLKSLYSFSLNLNQFELAKKSTTRKREKIYDILIKQNSQFEYSEVTNNLKLLKQENTFTVTTGHQLCLFTGPLYTINKIISTIKLCTELKEKYANYNFVPIFWMASEDHDFEEINHINVFNKKLTWNSKQKGAVGKFQLNDFDNFLVELNALFANSNNNIDRIISIYKNAETLSEATRKLVTYLFGKYGLLVLDANCIELKSEMIPIFEDELIQQTSYQLINQTNSKLNTLGYKVQASPRKINLFYLKDNFRERIILENDTYKILNTDLSFSKEEIVKELHKHPERFSPNVLLRPLYQEKILPNIAFIGGPSEIAYWLQLKSTFNHFNINFPSLILRNMTLLIPEHIQKKISKLNINSKDLFLSKNELIKRVITEKEEVSFNKEIQEIEKIFELTKNKAIQIDFSLEKTVIAELKKTENALKNIEKKVIKAKKNKEQTTVQQIEKIKNTLFPNNKLQERTINFLEFISDTPNLINKLIEEMSSPLEPCIDVIEL